MTLPYIQELSARHKPRAEAVAEVSDWLSALPAITLAKQTADLPELEAIAGAIIARGRKLLVLGTGGSSLGAQALCVLGDHSERVSFWNNIDPFTIASWRKANHLRDWHCLFISKSGGTTETMAQALLLAQWAIEDGVDIAAHSHVITMPGARPLRDWAEELAIPVIDHDPEVGGRYSILSPVGLLPAAVAGCDMAAIRRGAQRVVEGFAADSAAALGASWQAALMPSHPTSVLMPYCDRLKLYVAWVQQLWAESIGKDGKGSTPVLAMGATDQHSQLQLFLDGPKDKSFTFYTLAAQHHLPPVHTRGIAGLDYLDGACCGEILAAMQHGTIETVRAHEIPLRVIHLQTLDEEAMGALLMHAMIETMLTAALIGVNAFDQPAVEEGKVRARDYLLARQMAKQRA